MFSKQARFAVMSALFGEFEKIISKDGKANKLNSIANRDRVTLTHYLATEMNWTLDQLNIFVNCAQAGSFSAAARLLRCSQSKVSTAISDLETDLGVSLFSREAYKPVLTSAGDQLYKEAIKILDRCNTFQNNAALHATRQQISFVVALDEALPTDKCEQVFSEFAQAYPNARLSIKTGSLGDISHWIDQHEADVGLSFGLNILPPNIERRTISRFEQRLIICKDHPLNSCWDNINALKKYRQLVILDNMNYSSAEVISNNYWYVDNYYGISSFVSKGVGWAIVPEHIATLSEDVSAFHVEHLPVIKYVDITLLKNLDTQDSSITQWFFTMLSV